MERKGSKPVFDKILTVFLVLSGGMLSVVLIREAFHPSIIGDETFSMNLIRQGFGDVIGYTAIDVHPPLYYLILKSIVSLSLVLPVQAVTLGKLASVLPYFLLSILCVTRIRKVFGGFAAALFFCCIMGMPQMLEFGVEIRMYSWGMFFVTAAYLAMYDVLNKEKEKKALAAFILLGLMAAYTHYFACIAIAALYISLFLWFAVYERSRLREWYFCAVVTAAGYLPWLPVAIRQTSIVREGYWIDKITFSTLVSYFQFIFNPAVYRFHMGTILGGILFLTGAATVAGLYIRGKRQKDFKEGARKEWYYILSGVFVVAWVIAVGMTASLLLRPVLVERYLFMSLGSLWLGFAIGVSLLREGFKRAVVSVFVILVSCINLCSFARLEQQRRDGWDRLEEVLEEAGPEDVLLANVGKVRLALSYRMPENTVCYYWRQQTEELFHELYGNLKDTRDVDVILENLTDENEIYFFDTIDIHEFHFQDDCTYGDIVFQNLGVCQIEDIPVRVYRVTRNK